MNILRRIIVVLLGLAFGSLLYLNVALISFNVTFGNPATVKKALKDSGAYNHVFESVIKQTAATQPNEASIPIDDPGVKAAAREGGHDWQVVAEQFIDGTYSWLDGKTTKPDFSINLNPITGNFGTNVASYLNQRLKNLPACPPGTPVDENTDPFKAKCLPPGLNVDEQTAQIQQSLAQSGGNQSITANSLEKNNPGQQPLFERLKWIPKLFQWRNFFMFASIIGSLLTAALIFVVSPDHLKGLRRVAHSLLISGILLLVSALLVYLFNAGVGGARSVGQAQPIVGQVVLPILTTIANMMNKIVLAVGGVYTALAVGIYIFLKRHKPITSQTVVKKS